MMGTKFLEWFIKIWLVLAFMLAMVSPFAALFAMLYWWCK